MIESDCNPLSDRANIGDIVYVYKCPLNPGIVLSVKMEERIYRNGFKISFQMAKVRWLKTKTLKVFGHIKLGTVTLKGKILEVPTARLNDFNQLILDQEKKLNTNKENRNKLLTEINNDN